jgi:hypothetical protein
MFHEDAVVILLTETPVASEALAKAFEESYGIFPQDNRGLEYKVGKGFWVMYLSVVQALTGGPLPFSARAQDARGTSWPRHLS